MPSLSARRPWVGVIALLFAVCGASLAQQVATPAQSPVEVSSACLWDKPLVG